MVQPTKKTSHASASGSGSLKMLYDNRRIGDRLLLEMRFCLWTGSGFPGNLAFLEASLSKTLG